MVLRGRWGIEPETPCSYLGAEETRFEAMWLSDVDDDALSELIAQGYRHFGRSFFRPYCRSCHACVPIRLPVEGFRETRSVRKTIHRARHVSVRVGPPQASPQAFELYRAHKTRFAPLADGREELRYEGFAKAFFHPFTFARVLEMWEGERLLAVSHFDLTADMLSAIYCYYDPEATRLSLGRLAIYLQLRLAREQSIPYLYLGYYIKANKNMCYKADYWPNEVLLGDHGWEPFVDANGELVLAEDALESGFRSCGRPVLG